jgi:ABC-type antimicrobial peptide transport system permease subunit
LVPNVLDKKCSQEALVSCWYIHPHTKFFLSVDDLRRWMLARLLAILADVELGNEDEIRDRVACTSCSCRT